jgi:hypothetical protein
MNVKGLFSATVLVAVLVVPGIALGVTLPPDEWGYFYWNNNAGDWVTYPYEGFHVTSASTFAVTVTDVGVSGDAFDVYVGGSKTLIFSTPHVDQTPGITVGDNYDAALASPLYSHGSVVLPAGTYDIHIWVREQSPGYSGGGGGIRAEATPVPISPSLLLLASGLVGLRRKFIR